MGALWLGLQDEVDDVLGHDVRQAEIGAGDDDEADHDRGRLTDLTAVRPLHALELGPARGQEADDPFPPTVACRLMGGYAAGTLRATPARGDGGVLGLGEEI